MKRYSLVIALLILAHVTIAQTIPLDPPAERLIFADMNGDGLEDAISLSISIVSDHYSHPIIHVYERLNSNEFAPGVATLIDSTHVGFNQSIRLAAFDNENDGDIDLLFFGLAEIQLISNDGAGNLTKDPEDPININYQWHLGYWETNVYGIVIEDYDMDGIVDVGLVANTLWPDFGIPEQTEYYIEYTLNQGTSEGIQQPYYSTLIDGPNYNEHYTTGYASGCTAADINGDNYKETLMLDLYTSTSLSMPSSRILAADELGVTELLSFDYRVEDFVAIDADHDGDIDLVVDGHILYLNDGSGVYDTSFVATSLPQLSSFVCEDFDNNGLWDIIGIRLVDNTPTMFAYMQSTNGFHTIETDHTVSLSSLNYRNYDLNISTMINDQVMVHATAIDRQEVSELMLIDLSFCPFSTDGNHELSNSDFAQLNSDWGPCENCSSDLNGDGEVNIDDLIILNTAFVAGCD